MDAIAALRQRLLSSPGPALLVIAGPNGAGKTTFFESMLEQQLRVPFVNADRIAKTMPRATSSGKPPDEVAFHAARLMREQLIESRVSFCLETVFSDPVGDKLEFFRVAQASGYIVAMVFVGLDSAELSARRVEQRVALGGHAVPPARLRQRFPRVLANLRKALRFLDMVVVLDNSETEEVYREIAVYEQGKPAWQARDLPAWFRKVRAA